MLACHLKVIKEADTAQLAKLRSKRKALHRAKTAEPNLQSQVHFLIQQQQSLNQTDAALNADVKPENSKVQIVFKLIGQVQVIQKFVKDFASGQQGPRDSGSARAKDSASFAPRAWLGQARAAAHRRQQGRSLFSDVTAVIREMVAADNRFLVFSAITNQIKKMFKFIQGRQLQVRGKYVTSYKQKKQAVLKQAAEGQHTPELRHSEFNILQNDSLLSSTFTEKPHQHFREDD